MYKKVSTKLDFVEREKEILEFWKENEIFKKSIENREGSDVFTFYDGPPTANGKPHIGHILTRVIKDIIPRYKTMKGYKVLRKAGWDTHGLPVELEVEKLLGINGKPEIVKYGVEPFIKQCKESVWKYKAEWEKMSDRVGFWADMENPYITYDNNYIESEWWALKKIWDKGLIYKGHKVIPYCPRCGTSLSSHEVAQGYKDVKEKSVIAKFKVKGKENEFILAWTTTPWTLPSNVALCVNKKESYVKVKCENELYILAEELLESVLDKEYEIVEKYSGQDLVGMEYTPLFDFVKPEKKAWYIVEDNYVTLSDGTGIVHIAPAFGEDDASVGKRFDLPFVQLVNEEGKFTKEAYKWEGVFVKDADPKIIIDLEERGLLFKSLDFEHSYPFCWRCDTALIYYARSSWFIKMTEVREKLLENNKKINWYPPAIGENRFGNFLDSVVDWSVSRERYWGTPLPIWECKCGHRHLIGSIEELKQMGTDVPENIELHKPYIDNVHITCPKCNGIMTRVPEVIDCWFDSGSMPFAQWHYPFENKELFNENFPADFISEALDQTRGWFYTLHAISTLLFDGPAFKNCVVLGLVQDKDGAKMSKHKGNVVDPWTVLDKQGADAIRWHFYVSSAPWLPSRFYEEAVGEGQRKFIGTFWNTYAFYVLYADIDKFDPSKYTLESDKLNVMDKWVLSRLNTLVGKVDEYLENYKITEAARDMQQFVEELSNWYVRRSRERFWKKDMPQDKINAYMTLYTVLSTLATLSAPFTSFMAESIYQNIVKPFNSEAAESIHLCDFPAVNTEYIDTKLEENMDELMKVVVLGRACRNNASIKNRQPIGKMYIKANYILDNDYLEIIKEELNVKVIEYTDDTSMFTQYLLKPQLRTLGPKYGRHLAAISQHLREADGNNIMKTLNSGEKYILDINGEIIELALEDVIAQVGQKQGFIAQEEGDVSVVLDTNLTEVLINEGFVREIISKVQNMRKDAGFEVTDKIVLYVWNNDKILDIIENNYDKISSEVLANNIEITKASEKAYSKEWNLNGEEVNMAVER